MDTSGERTPQLETLTQAVQRFSPQLGIAVDGGANIGAWTIEMVRLGFTHVHAFEPAPETATILRDNLIAAGCLGQVSLHEVALWSHTCNVNLVVGGKPTSWHVFKAKHGALPAVDLDSLHLDNVGLIKLDLEGAEYLALRGAIQTIQRSHPLLIVEVIELYAERYGNTAADLTTLLTKLGYHPVMTQFLHKHDGYDVVFKWGGI